MLAPASRTGWRHEQHRVHHEAHKQQLCRPIGRALTPGKAEQGYMRMASHLWLSKMIMEVGQVSASRLAL